MIPQEVVGVARAALFEEAAKFHGDWDERNDALVTAALEAAAPFIRAQALEDAADEGWKAMLVVASRKQMIPGADDFRDWLRARAATERGQG